MTVPEGDWTGRFGPQCAPPLAAVGSAGGRAGHGAVLLPRGPGALADPRGAAAGLHTVACVPRGSCPVAGTSQPPVLGRPAGGRSPGRPVPVAVPAGRAPGPALGPAPGARDGCVSGGGGTDSHDPQRRGRTRGCRRHRSAGPGQWRVVARGPGTVTGPREAAGRRGAGPVFRTGSHSLGGASGGGVYSNRPLARLDSVAGSAFHIPTLQVTVAAGGRPVELAVTNVHTQAPVEDETPRWRSDLALLGSVASRPGNVLLLGDFNATYDHAEFREMLAGGPDNANGTGSLVDAGVAALARFAPPGQRTGSCCPAWSSTTSWPARTCAAAAIPCRPWPGRTTRPSWPRCPSPPAVEREPTAGAPCGAASALADAA